jgi:hypothetical protein
MAPYSMDLRKRVLRAWDAGLDAEGVAAKYEELVLEQYGLGAATERATPRPASRATVASRCRNRTRDRAPHNRIKIETSSETLTHFAIRHAQVFLANENLKTRTLC